MPPPPVPLALLVLSLVSFGLLSGLAILWFKTYRETRSKFSLGLLLFAVVLAFQEVARLVVFFSRAARHGNLEAFGALELAGAVGQVVALGILIYLVAR